MHKIDVVPTKESAKALVHPVHGVLGEGASWGHDTFTSRRLTDGSIARAPAKAEPATEERADEKADRMEPLPPSTAFRPDPKPPAPRPADPIPAADK